MRWIAVTLVLSVVASRLSAQTGVQLQGLVDAEAWSTDTGSTFLTRHRGNPGMLGRLRLWGAVEPLRGIVLYAHVASEHGSASQSTERTELEQLGLRYTASRRFVVDAGKLANPVGTFSARRFSTRNPLIGVPDAYPAQYAGGAQIAGVARMMDYRVAIIDLPAVHAGYTPVPDRAWRPVIGGGITPVVGLRFGASFTTGPYLNKSLTPAQLAQRGWRSYKQRVTAADLALSIGYFELRAEAAAGGYDVPNRAESIDGLAYYAEGKYTFTPRLYLALRLERNDYPFIRDFPTFWVARKTDFHDEELGIGYRLTATTLLKLSGRQDRWHVDGSNQAFVKPGGKAIAFQLSQSYDVMDWIERARARR